MDGPASRIPTGTPEVMLTDVAAMQAAQARPEAGPSRSRTTADCEVTPSATHS